MSRRHRVFRWLFTCLSRATVADIYHQGYRDGVNEVRDGMAAHQQAQSEYHQRQTEIAYARGFTAGQRRQTPLLDWTAEVADVQSSTRCVTWFAPEPWRPS